MKAILPVFLAAAFMSAGTLFAQEKASLGVTLGDNTPGVLVTNVVEGSPAAKIGLQAGDRILAINNQPTHNYRDVIRIIGASRPNTPVVLTVVRGPWKANLKVALATATAMLAPAPKYVPAARPTHPVPDVTPDWKPYEFDTFRPDYSDPLQRSLYNSDG